MKGSPLTTVVKVWQLVLGLLLVGVAIYVMTLTRSRETLADPDAADAIRGLWIGAALLGIPGVITLIGVLGLWRGQFWGWVLSLASDVGVLAVLAFNFVVERDRDGEEIGLALGLMVPVVLLLLPGVKKFYWAASSKNLSS